MAAGTLDTTSEPCLHRATDPDTAFCSSLGQDDTMDPGDRASHSDQDVPGGCMVLGSPRGQRLRLRPQASMWSLVAAWAMDTNSDPGCGRTTDPDMV